MQAISLEPETAPSYTLPFEETLLVPLGDIQYGAQGCDTKRLKKHIDWAEDQREKGKAVYYTGMGDYLDVASPSNRKLIYKMKVDAYDSVNAMMDRAMNQQIEEVKNILSPTRGHWLGLVTGHHNYEFDDGSTVDTRLANWLGCAYLGNCAITHLVFRSEDKKSKTVCKIWQHHGESMGTTLEAAIRVLRTRVVPYWNANLYLIGHFHNKVSAPMPWIDTHVKSNGEVEFISKSRYLVGTGSYLKGYLAGAKDARGRPSGEYAEKRMLPPNVLGGPLVFIRPRRKGSHNEIDISVGI